MHRREGEKWIIEEAGQLEARHSEVIKHLELDDLDGLLHTDEKFGNLMRLVLAKISAVFRDNNGSKSIVLGAQWLLDSYCGTDELLQYVQAAVVVEILLGDKAVSDQMGLGELLANRCAYLIANSHSMRNEILEVFRKIYDVRSKIVHRGKSQLTKSERYLFFRLRWICSRIIQEEVRLIANEKSE